MAKYRKRPVTIDAVQWWQDGDHPAVKRNVIPEGGTHPPLIWANEGEPYIETLEGNHLVRVGDWIITGVAGEHYPCRPDIFEKTYESSDTDCLMIPADDWQSINDQLIAAKTRAVELEAELDAKHAKLVEVADKYRALRDDAIVFDEIGPVAPPEEIARRQKAARDFLRRVSGPSAEIRDVVVEISNALTYKTGIDNFVIDGDDWRALRAKLLGEPPPKVDHGGGPS